MGAFNPYHKWLGIPPDQQPVSHYRLLGIENFEVDADVIEIAAERQTLLLRTFQTGPNSELAERLLNEISAARVCLLDGKSKARYDTQLRAAQQPDPEEDPEQDCRGVVEDLERGGGDEDSAEHGEDAGVRDVPTPANK